MNIALILSGGTGTRLGFDIPKQYIDVCGKPVINYSLDTIEKCSCIDAVIIVAATEWQEFISAHIKSEKLYGFAVPGETRQLSIYSGLCRIRNMAKNDDIVLIHDAARPLVSEKLISDCIETAKMHEGALPVLPMKDTVYYSENGRLVSSLLQREKVFAGQAPEAFIFGKYLEANEQFMPEKILKMNGSTEPAILAGMDIAMIPGDESNFKITTKADLVRFKEIMRAKQ